MIKIHFFAADLMIERTLVRAPLVVFLLISKFDYPNLNAIKEECIWSYERTINQGRAGHMH
jgi:hypothetical protein